MYSRASFMSQTSLNPGNGGIEKMSEPWISHPRARCLGSKDRSIVQFLFLKIVMPHRILQHFWTRADHFFYSAAVFVNLECW